MRIQVIDSHTGGEPTRVVLSGAPELQGATMAERAKDLGTRLDHLRNGLVNEPRGSEVLVGAYVTPPVSEGALVGVTYFNNAGVLGMCGHGTIGLVETLRHLGRIDTAGGPQTVRIDTPVGAIVAKAHENGQVSIQNIGSYRYRTGIEVRLADGTTVKGDIAYGGNWFYLVREPHYDLRIQDARELSRFTIEIMDRLRELGITGENGAVIDHVELFGDAVDPTNHSRNFVMCPGGAYDRSPCGTGTSAKLACLAAEGSLEPGTEYRQESITGSVFIGSYQWDEERVIPTLRGTAHVTAESTLIFDDRDPLRWGFA